MQDYLRSLWAMLTPFKEDTIPLLACQYDLEAYGQGGSHADGVVVVCDTPPVPPHGHSQHVRVSPFSEQHFPGRPFVFTSDA